MDPKILLDAFKLKPEAAVAFLRAKGYAFSWRWQDVWREMHSRAFTVAKVMRADILQDIRTMVDKAIDEGITFEQFRKELAPRLQAQGWWGKKEIVNKETGLVTEVQLGSPQRLRTIYQTNLQSAYGAGRYRRQAALADVRPIWMYRLGAAKKHTDGCAKLEGFTARADDPIWKKIYPPNHFGCTGRVQSLSERQAGRRGLSADPAEMVERTAVVGRGENAMRVSVTGVQLRGGGTYFPDPGWDYNPGDRGYAPDKKKYDADIGKWL